LDGVVLVLRGKEAPKMADEKKGEPDPKEPGPLPIPEEEKTPEEPGYGHGV